MLLRTWISLIGVLLLGCTNSVSEPFHIIGTFNEAHLKDSSSLAYDYYAKHNIIILDHSDSIFYHDFYLGCGTGWSVYDPPRPVNFDLWPMRINRSVREVLDTVRVSKNTPRLIMLVSDVDTVRNSHYFALKDSLSKMNQTYIFTTRLITSSEQEEIDRLLNK